MTHSAKMFLRPHQRNKDGKDHTYWSLVETVRTVDGPRQRTLCYLGELNGSAQARWLKSVEVFNEQGEAQQLKLFPSHLEVPHDDPQVARVLVNRVRLERTRQFGACFLGWELWRRLGLDGFYEQAMDGEAAEVPWSRVAAVLAINRLCAPGSELAIEERWYPSTALDDLLEIEEGKINDTRLYRCLDRILPHKTKLEQHLKQRYGELFGAEFDVLLYDLTSTYVEGAAEKNAMMGRGYSRDHRPDCEQMVIALIVNREGFPFSYETFDGNRADVSTMESILRMVERKYGKARRIWVMDRGIVSEENLAAIRKRGGQYLVGTPRRQMKRFEAELLQDDWTQVRADVEVKQVAIPTGEETYILCRTAARKEKEKAIRKRFSTRMEAALEALEKNIARGRLKDRYKMERRLGRIQARQPAGERSVRSRSARHTRRRTSGMGNERRPKGLARLARRRVHAAHQSAGGFDRADVVHVHATDRSRGLVSRAQERAIDSAFVSSQGAAGQGPRPGGFSGVCLMGDTEASAAATVCDRPTIFGQRSGQRSALLADEGTGIVVHVAERRHRTAHHGRTRDPLAPDYRTHGRTEIPAAPARPQSSGTAEITFKM